jgi:metal-dependent amidase/aminoacylase/carboxypeptidase family protein
MMKRAGNVISAQAFLLERLHTVVEGLEHDGAGCHCTVGDVRTDGAWNIVPRLVTVKGSVRTFTAELRAEALQRLEDLLLEADTEFQVSSELRLVHGTVPLRNDPNVTSTVLEIAGELVGERANRLGMPLTVSDDMAEFLTRIPGCYFMLGARPPDAEVAPAHHSPTFRIDEASFATGVRMMAATAARLAQPVAEPPSGLRPPPPVPGGGK